MNFGKPAVDMHNSSSIDKQLVYLDYDQAALDAAYNQAAYAPHSEHVRKRMVEKSEQVRAIVGAPQRYAYGTAEIEKLDVYRSDKVNAPIHVFIHGGAWRRGLASQNAFPAEMFLNAGINYVVPDFSWVQDAQDSLRTLADQVCRALLWVFKNAANFNGNPDRIYLSGHSSGAHLAAVALTTDWQKTYDSMIPANFIKGAVLCSGMYDLRPVRLSARSSYVKFDDDIEYHLSPQRHIERINAPIVLLFGTRETPEFQRHSREFATMLEKAGKPVRLVVVSNYDHFEIKETLGNPYGPFGHAVLEQTATQIS